MLLGNLLPVIALLTNKPWANVNYLEFIFRLFILDLTCLVPFIWIGNQGWLRPQKAKLISWEIVFFYFLRWPWVLIGVLNAIVCSLLNTTLEFKVTPKGKDAPKFLPLKGLLPYLFLGFISAATVIMFQHRSNVQGYHFLALVNSICYIGLSAAIIWQQMHENQNKTQRYLRHKLALLGTFIVLITAVSLKLPKNIISTVGLDNIYQSLVTDRTSPRDKAPD